jgi:hypothetical protein
MKDENGDTIGWVAEVAEDPADASVTEVLATALFRARVENSMTHQHEEIPGGPVALPVALDGARERAPSVIVSTFEPDGQLSAFIVGDPPRWPRREIPPPWERDEHAIRPRRIPI